MTRKIAGVTDEAVADATGESWDYWFSGADSRPLPPSRFDLENSAPDGHARVPSWWPHCETETDPTYRSCGHCGAKLPSVKNHARTIGDDV